MTTYTPDRWVMMKITPHDPTIAPHYRVFCGWWGGYAGSDTWKLSSGNLEVVDRGDYWEVPQHSGSTYHLRKSGYGYTNYMQQVFHHSLTNPQSHLEYSMSEVNLNEFPIHQCK